ncbi:MAG: hypothetical protein WC443_01610 [Desulfobaccales bacterium]
MHPPKWRKLTLFLALAAALCLTPLAASAALTFDFDLNSPNLALSTYTGPYATVHIDVTSGNAEFTVTGLPNSTLQYLLGGEAAFAANFATEVTLSGFDWTDGNGSTAFTPAYDYTPPTFQVSEFGRFNVKIDDFDGYGAAVTSLTFTATPSSGTFTDAASVLVNNSNTPAFYAASHIFVQDTLNPTEALTTGFAGNGDQGVVIPLPPTVWLMGTGLLGVGLLGWRRKKV